jgi:hypothetical protein
VRIKQNFIQESNYIIYFHLRVKKQKQSLHNLVIPYVKDTRTPSLGLEIKKPAGTDMNINKIP